MDLALDASLSVHYTSPSQIARRLTEGWVRTNMYCPRCGNSNVSQCSNNAPVSDFSCPSCKSIFELKSKNGYFGEKVTDGAYNTMIQRITSNTNPDFLFLEYDRSGMQVHDLVVVPRQFLVPTVIERRFPLTQTARRAGWVGCNILLSVIPKQGRIPLIVKGKIESQESVIEKLNRTKLLTAGDFERRGWVFDVLTCINTIQNDSFSLAEVYGFEDILTRMHPKNNNIQAKIRQQLQVLRDAGYIEFTRRGKYRKIDHE